MKNQEHFVIFSHGFGVKKDDRGLLTNIADSLANCTSILFDYFNVDEINKTITITSFGEQVKRLENVYNQTRSLHPDAVIDIIGHSQGTIIPPLAKLKGVRKTILLASPFDMSIERTIERYSKKPDCELNLDGMSRFYRLDGYYRFVPKEYWVERKNIKPAELFNEFSKQTELIIINANQDTILGAPNLSGLNSNIQVISLDGNHGFDGQDRDGLLKVIKEIIEK